MADLPPFDSYSELPGPSVEEVPEGDNRKRLICPDCGYIAYQNPKIVSGALCVYEDRFLLCRRDIEPRRGFWTMPAGYLELNESTADGAVREAREEANAIIEIESLIGIYEIPHISQLYVIHLARLVDPNVSAGDETTEVGLFRWDEIPWDDLAFSSVKWALDRHRDGMPADVGYHEPGF